MLMMPLKSPLNPPLNIQISRRPEIYTTERTSYVPITDFYRYKGITTGLYKPLPPLLQHNLLNIVSSPVIFIPR
jgi:hypothetical protein